MAANLLNNGSFSRGAVGFATGYDRGGSSLVPVDTYVVGTDPHKYHPAGADFGDHTTGKGKMLMVNGSTTAGTTVWRETVPVIRGVTYSFEGWAASWATVGPDGGDISPAQLQITINGQALSTTDLPTTTGLWTELAGSWLATSARATITITDFNIAAGGNDSAYDDFTFTPLASIHGSVVSDSVAANGKTSRHVQALPDVTVYLDTNDNGILDPGELTAVTAKSGAYTFSGLTAGTYVVRQADPPTYNLPPAQLVVNVTASKQLARQNLKDLYTAVAPAVDILK